MIVYPSNIDNQSVDDIPDYRDDDSYNTNYSKAAIGAYLRRVKSCIKAGRFVVLDNEDGSRPGRQKNLDFMNKFGLYTKESQMNLLLGVDVEDFCHSVRSSDGRHLYVFCIQRLLYKTGSGTCSVQIYIKHDCPEGNDPTDVVVSMHELEKPIEKIFID